jgi:hypothetical protein
VHILHSGQLPSRPPSRPFSTVLSPFLTYASLLTLSSSSYQNRCIYSYSRSFFPSCTRLSLSFFTFFTFFLSHQPAHAATSDPSLRPLLPSTFFLQLLRRPCFTVLFTVFHPVLFRPSSRPFDRPFFAVLFTVLFRLSSRPFDRPFFTVLFYCVSSRPFSTFLSSF